MGGEDRPILEHADFLEPLIESRCIYRPINILFLHKVCGVHFIARVSKKTVTVSSLDTRAYTVR